ncbi:hypothetical protein KGP36_02660 [Patescibacteria group bacterium]|nr:hypothetical protein [Patescibacteria group bacterium]
MQTTTKPKEPEYETAAVIESGIPIPRLGNALWGEYRRLIESMEVGQSFKVDTQHKRDRILRINAADKHSTARVTSRRLLDGSGWRIWRIA